MLDPTSRVASRWTRSAAVVVGPGAVAFALAPSGPVWPLAAVAVLGAMVSWGLRVEAWRAVPGLVAGVLADGLRAGVVGVAAYGWFTWIGPWVFVLVPWMLGLQPEVTGWAVSVKHTVRRRSGPQVEDMSTPEIGVVWRWSGWELHRANPGRLTRLVLLRQRCLDELERRDALALASWLESEPPATSDPTTYFVEDT